MAESHPSPMEWSDLLVQMHQVLARLDDYALNLPASYVQLAIDHVRALAEGAPAAR